MKMFARSQSLHFIVAGAIGFFSAPAFAGTCKIELFDTHDRLQPQHSQARADRSPKIQSTTPIKTKTFDECREHVKARLGENWEFPTATGFSIEGYPKSFPVTLIAYRYSDVKEQINGRIDARSLNPVESCSIEEFSSSPRISGPQSKSKPLSVGFRDFAFRAKDFADCNVHAREQLGRTWSFPAVRNSKLNREYKDLAVKSIKYKYKKDGETMKGIIDK